MVTPEIINYIKQQIASGVSREQISTSLKQNGWNDTDLAEAFSAPNGPINSIPKAPQIASSHVLRNFIIAIIILVLLSGAGWVFFQKNKSNPTIQNEVVSNTEVQTPQAVNFDDLKISYVAVSSNENSASIFNAIPVNFIAQADNDFFNKYFPSNSFINMNSTPVPESKKILTKYKSVLNSFELGTSKQYYQCSLAMEEKCQLNLLRSVAKLAVLNSFILYKEGKVIEAQDYAQKIIKLGQMVTSQSDDPINLLVGWSVQKTGYDLLGKIKSSVPLSFDTKTTLINNLREEQKKVFRFIYTRYIEGVDYLTDINKKPSEVVNQGAEDYFNEIRKSINSTTWKPDTIKKWYLDSLKIELSNADLPCGSAYKDSKIDLGFDPKDISQTDNFVGKTLYSVNYGSLSTMGTKRCEIEDLINAL